MVYYLFLFVLFLFSLCFGFNGNTSKTKSYKHTALFVGFLIVLFGGLRYQVGADWGAYLEEYNILTSWDAIINSRYEKLYGLSNLLANCIGLSYSFFVFAFFVISFGIKYKTFKSFSPNIFLSVLIYFYTVFINYDINGIRQGMALALTFFSIKYICNRQLFRFLLCCTVAIGFHNSAIFFIPAYWLYNLKFDFKSYKSIIVVIAVILVAIPLRITIESYVATYLAAEELLNHYSVYMTSDYNVGGSIITAGTIQRIVIFIIYAFSLNANSGKNTNFELFLAKAYFAGLVIFIFLSFSMEYASRLSFCYKIMETLMMPIAIMKVPKNSKIIELMIVFIFAIISMYQALHLPNQGFLLPYQNQLLLF